MNETKYREIKETVTNTFLKTVSAFANYSGGEILFGIADDGTVKGIENSKNVCLDIENRLNDSISPNPDYSFEIDDRNVITLKISAGPYKPYLYKGKAYRRNDTATIEVDKTELDRLILSGRHLYYDSLPAGRQELTFDYLQRKTSEILGVDSLSPDILKTLELYSDPTGFNNAAMILSEQNSFPGIDIVKFGSSMDIIEDRERESGCSVLEQYDKAVSMFKKYYVYERIEKPERTVVYRIPEKAFREALANAVVHRSYDINAYTRVAMFRDKIEISSPGGLPDGISEREYLNGQVSILRNPVIGMLFYRLRLTEMFGTGIKRIKEAYADSPRKPVFEIYENSVRITLPVTDAKPDISEQASEILKLFGYGEKYSAAQIAERTGFHKSKVLRLLKELSENDLVKISGTGRGTKYSRED